MARIPVSDGLALECDVDDYLWPWDTATPVVMVHGFARNATFWNRWVPPIARTHRVYRPELRGFGRSDAPPDDYRYEGRLIVEDLLAVVDACAVERAHFVGESSGGVFSVLFALAHPERVASLILCNTPLRITDGLKATYALGEPSMNAALLKYGVGEWCRQTLQYRLDLEKASPELQDWYVGEMAKSNATFAAAINEVVDTFDLAPRIAQLQIPVLLMTGDKSKISSEQQAEFAQRLPRGEIRLFEGYGHGVNVLIPEACAEAALEFWNRVA
jgi:pimeloyl-ACP methyl ester carboxylesterase